MSEQLKELQKLYAKSKEYKIPKNPIEGQEQATITITPLSLEDMGLFAMDKDATPSDIAKETITMLSKCLGISKEEIGKISFEYLQELINAVTEINNFQNHELDRANKVKNFINSKT
jgi:hypothetical protein